MDEPALAGLMPPVTLLTAQDAYVRFHGRNAKAWFDSHNVVYQTYWNSNASFPGKLSDGKFPRSESGRYYPLQRGEPVLANVCRGSRKDFRDAVLAARNAFGAWSRSSNASRGTRARRSIASTCGAVVAMGFSSSTS